MSELPSQPSSGAKLSRAELIERTLQLGEALFDALLEEVATRYPSAAAEAEEAEEEEAEEEEEKAAEKYPFAEVQAARQEFFKALRRLLADPPAAS